MRWRLYLNDYQDKLCLNFSVISDSISSNSKESKERIEAQVGSSVRDAEENYNLSLMTMRLIQGCTTKWTDWFAWYPVRLEDDSIVWLETVRRKMYYYNGPLNLDRTSWKVYRRK